MKSDQAGAPAPVAIVGGGFSGTMAAAQLAQRGIASYLIEGGGRLARGTAYSTPEAAHLLNVRAAMMSAWDDRPHDFAAVVEAEGGSADDFAERRRFGAYLGAIHQEAVNSGLVHPVEGAAVAACRDERAWVVRLDDGHELRAQALVLANGNQLPASMRVAEEISTERFINDPWGEQARGAVERLADAHGAVLILGTGLTMVDMVLSLDSAGHRGSIVALSRRGQIPRSHAEFQPAPVELGEVPAGNVPELWRWLRRRAGAVGWRAAVDALRPHSQALWQALANQEQRRFLRHARPWWDVHRHRIAPQVAKQLHEMVAEGRLEIVAGRVGEIVETDEALEIAVDRRRGGSETVAVEVAFNCTGPLGEMARTRDPLLRQLLDDGEIAIDALGVGLDVDEHSRAGERIWALGPLTKGRYWEIIAVPDIRGQVAAVAADIAMELGR